MRLKMSQNYQRKTQKAKGSPLVLPLAALAVAITVVIFVFVIFQKDGQNRNPMIPGVAENSSSQTSSKEEVNTTPVKIQMAGDILLHTTVTGSAQTGENTYDFTPFFSSIKPYFDGDLKICNMESPVDVSGGNQKITSYPTFNVPHEILDGLKYMGINTLNTCNNHAYDKGFTGLVATRKNILTAGFAMTGTNETQEQYDQYLIQEFNGIKIGMISYTDSDNGITIPEQYRGYAMRKFNSNNTDDVPDMIADIKKCKEAGAEFIIMSMHWGAEYADAPTAQQKQIAHMLVDGGADIIMGSHSHCVQPIEKRKTTIDGVEKEALIIYSMGNFFADQIALKKPKTQDSMIVNATIARNAETKRVEIISMNYMPTITFRYDDPSMKVYKSGTPKRNYQILPLGKSVSERPSYCKTDSGYTSIKTAWERVKKIVGSEIEVYAG